MRIVALVLIAACGGAPATPVAEPPRLRIVGCELAPIVPRIPAADHDDEDNEAMYGGLVGGGGTAWGTIGEPRGLALIAIGNASSTARVGALPMRRHLRERIDAIGACYRAVQKTEPKARGRVVAKFGLDRTGAPTNLVTDGPPALAACVKDAIAAMRVPPPSDPAAVFEYPFELGFDPLAPSSALSDEDPASAWTPYTQIELAVPDERAPLLARAGESAVRQRIVELEACVPPVAPTGSLRTMLSILDDGSVAYARAGGLGGGELERCVAEVLGDLRLGIRANDYVELACDLSRGEAQPWRLATDAYGVIEVTAKGVTYGTTPLEYDPEVDSEPEALPGDTSYAIVVAPDAPAVQLSSALAWAREGIAALVATRDAKSALTYVAPGRVLGSISDDESDSMSPHPSLVVGAGTVRACMLAHDRRAKLADAAAVTALLRELRDVCKRNHCAPTLGIAHDPATPMRDVLAVTAAVRREGFTRVLLDAFSTCRDR